jgi:hypothetical protein
VNQVNRVLQKSIAGGDYAGIGLIVSLESKAIGKFLRDIDRRGFQRA